MSGLPEGMRGFRDVLANAMLRDNGVEIGAGNAPIRFSDPAIKPIYVDFAPKEELVNVHGFSPDWTEPNLVEDGNALPSIAPASIGFVIACHVLEHTQDPVTVLNTWFSKVVNGGLVFIAIPHRDHGFDSKRPLTSTQHLFDDHLNPARSERAHLIEWCKVVNGLTDEAKIEWSVAELKRTDYRIHYHVWDTDSFLDFLLEYRSRMVDFDIEFYGRNVNEIIAVLRKKPQAQARREAKKRFGLF